jgi:hypothetical protein
MATADFFALASLINFVRSHLKFII